MDALPEAARDRLLALGQRWGEAGLFQARMAAILDSLRDQVGEASLSDAERAGAARRLIGLADQPDAVALILNQVTLLSPPGLAGGFLNALAESRNADTAAAILARWSQFTPLVRRTVIAILMRRAQGALALLEAVQDGRINRTDLAPDHWSQLRQNPDRRVARRAERLADVNPAISADREAVVKRLLPLAQRAGDAARGREIFNLNCAVCHSVAGEGGKVGPELTGIGSRDRSDILLQILDPNRSVEANYRLWNVTTVDGETYSGRLDAETQTTVEILDTTSQKHVIQRRDIASLEGSSLSIMPTGFEALPEEDLVSLLDFLARPAR